MNQLTVLNEALHRKSLSATGLAVGKDRSVEASKHRVNHGLANDLEDGLLGGDEKRRLTIPKVFKYDVEKFEVL